MPDALIDGPISSEVARADPKPSVGANAALALLCVAQLMLVLDFSIVNVAMPSIKAALGFSESSLQWVISAYALTFGGFLMLGGRAADLFGRRRVFMGGLVLFSAASLLGGFARAPWMLVAARAIQGAGGAIVAPASLSLLTTTFAEGPARNRAMGWFGTMSTVGFAVGMILGGLLTGSMGWEWVMFINVPIGLVVIAIAPVVLPRSVEAPTGSGFDLLGAGLVTGASASLVFALSDAENVGWSSLQTLGLLGASVAQVAAFVFVESRVPNPLIPLRVFLKRDLMGANFVGFLLAAAIPAMILLLTFHMQRNLHYTPWITGLAFLPHAVVAFFAARVVPRVVDRFGPRAIMAWGAAIFGGSVLLLASMTPEGSYAVELLPGLAITPIGILFGFIASMIAATSGMPDDEQGLASGLLSTFQQIGQALGLALILNVVAFAERRGLVEGLAEAPARVQGYRCGFLVEAGFATLAVLVALLIVRKSKVKPAVGPVVTLH